MVVSMSVAILKEDQFVKAIVAQKDRARLKFETVKLCKMHVLHVLKSYLSDYLTFLAFGSTLVIRVNIQ